MTNLYTLKECANLSFITFTFAFFGSFNRYFHYFSEDECELDVVGKAAV